MLLLESFLSKIYSFVYLGGQPMMPGMGQSQLHPLNSSQLMGGPGQLMGGGGATLTGSGTALQTVLGPVGLPTPQMPMNPQGFPGMAPGDASNLLAQQQLQAGRLGSSVGSIPGLLGHAGGSLPSATTSLPIPTPVPPVQVIN